MLRKAPRPRPLPPLADQFGIRGVRVLLRDLSVAARGSVTRTAFLTDLSSAGLLQPRHALPAYAGLMHADGVLPIYNFFDRVAGDAGYRNAATRHAARDWRGKALSYDEHGGTDFICPPGTPITAAAPGVFVGVRDRWLRGGLTACVDHGGGVVTQYTHLSSVCLAPGTPAHRGQVIGASGVSGIDLTLFFPWVPPHLHFSVWVKGRLVDPYLAEGEAWRTGTWLRRNEPRALHEPLSDDPEPPGLADLDLDREGLSRVVALCGDDRVCREIESASNDAARVALCEDSLHHEPTLWPATAREVALRSTVASPAVSLTLPFLPSVYRAAIPIDEL